MAKKNKPNRPYSSEELKILLGPTMGKLIDKAEASNPNRLQNLALPGEGEIYQYQLRELVQHCVIDKGYEKLLEKKLNECDFGDCMDTLKAKIDDLRVMEYFLKRVDMDFRVSQLIDGIYDPNPVKGLKSLFVRTGSKRFGNLEGKE